MELKKRITLEEAIEMVNFVANAVFQTDKETGTMKYLPEVFDYTFRVAIAHYYGGFALTDDIETNYRTAMDINVSHLRDTDAIDFAQLNGIEQAIYEKIDWKKEELNKANITVTSQFDVLAPVVQTLIDTITNKVAEINMEKFNDTLSALNEELDKKKEIL